jgi:hypothetical protein
MGKGQPKARAGLTIPLDNSILAKLGREPIDITITLTLQAVGRGGALHLLTSVSKPRAKRRKCAGVNGAASRIPPKGHGEPHSGQPAEGGDVLPAIPFKAPDR